MKTCTFTYIRKKSYLSHEDYLQVLADMTHGENFTDHSVYRPGTRFKVLNKHTCDLTEEQAFHMLLTHGEAVKITDKG